MKRLLAILILTNWSALGSQLIGFVGAAFGCLVGPFLFVVSMSLFTGHGGIDHDPISNRVVAVFCLALFLAWCGALIECGWPRIAEKYHLEPDFATQAKKWAKSQLGEPLVDVTTVCEVERRKAEEELESLTNVL